MSEKFCLKWNDFQANVASSFRKLRSEEDFYDVTLVSDDRQQLSAHKIVLSASSEYFKTVLKSNKHSHPLLCLNGVNTGDLKNILDFIYNGEIQIYQEDLDQFLDIAQRFQLEGLNGGEESNTNDTEQFEDKAFQTDEGGRMDIIGKGESKSVVSVVKPQKTMVIESANFDNLEELDQMLNDMIERVDGDGKNRRCLRCGKISRDYFNAKEHAETHIEGLSFPCQYCNKSFRSRHSLRTHTRICQRP